MDYSNFYDAFRESLTDKSQAITELSFLAPTSDTLSLINNSTFVQSLACSIYDGDSYGNSSCIEACGNVSSILSNWQNFYTCSWYPTISKTLDNSNVTEAIVNSLSTLGISGNQISLSENISSTIATCLVDYCQSSPDCQALDFTKTCSMDNLLADDGIFKTLNYTGAINCLRHNVCGSTSSVNPDIGGLGVIISILIQYSISLLGICIHVGLCARYAANRRRLVRRSGVADLQKKLSLAKKCLDRHLETLTSALVEFQKTQCFFAATLQIAALIVLPPYFEQIQGKNQILLRLTSGNAFSPIMLTLVHINFLGGRDSGYLLLISSITFALGTATYWETEPQTTGVAEERFYTYTNPMAAVISCGNLAPYAPCYVQNPFFYYKLWPQFGGIFYSLPEKTGLVVWIVSFLILVYRVTYIIYKAERLEFFFKDITKGSKAIRQNVSAKLRSSKYTQKIPMRWRSHLGTPKSGEVLNKFIGAVKKKQFWDYLQICLGTLGLFLQVISIIQVLVWSTGIISTQMSFGQIVALGIWIPVMLEYGYLELSGVEEGMKYRLKSPLMVGKITTQGETGRPQSVSQSSLSVQTANIPRRQSHH